MRALLPSPAAAAAAPAPALLDPTRAEARAARAFVTLACIPALGTATSVRVSGVLEAEALGEGMKTLKSMYDVCGLLHGVAKDALLSARQGAPS
ncbi:3'-5'-exoribonuclease [Rhodotorula kratochvilovae]